MREQKRHDHIIAISQSELMLVVALVFLLLAFFAGAPAHRESAEEDPAGEAEQEELQPEEEESAEAAEEADPDEEVEETLSDEGEEQEGEGVEMVLVEEKTGSNHDFPHQEVTDEEIVRELVLALEKRGLLDEAAETEDGRRKELALQEVGKALERLGELEDLEADVDRILSDSGIGQHEDRQAAMRDLSEKLEEYRADEIGFTPCWRGDGSPAYYKAFDITYDPGTDTFLVARHADTDSGDPTVRQDVRSRLPALLEHPTGRVDRATMVAYARKLNAQKDRVHGSECQLATTIDEESRGRTVKFINNELNLYTVYR